jgi:hypothetical protein
MKRAIAKPVKQREAYKNAVRPKMAQLEHISGQRMEAARRKLEREKAEKEEQEAKDAAQFALTGIWNDVVQNQAPQCKHCRGTDHRRSSSKM